MGKATGVKTWQLWRALRDPQLEHPMYQQFLHASQRNKALKFTDIIPIPKVFLNTSLWGFISGFALVIFMCAGGWILVLPALATIPFIPLTGTIYGLFTAIRIAGYMTRERQKNRYNLIAITPHGLAGVTWAVASAVFHRSKNVSQLRDMVMGLYIVLYMVFVLLLMVAIMNTIFLDRLPITPNDWLLTIERYEFMRNTLLLGIAISALFIDFVQSIITGVLIGMMLPTYTKNATNARAVTLGLYLMIQFGIYAFVALGAIFVLPELMPYVYWQNDVLLAVLQLLLLITTREALLFFLWHKLADRFITETNELNYVIAGK